MNQNQRIKNYSTSVSSVNTQIEIEKMLIAFGASAIAKEYTGDGRTESFRFILSQRSYKLPVDVQRCMTLLNEIPEYARRDSIWREAQAERVAWRVLRDWLDAQIALIRIGQAQPDQVMLPYMWNGKESLYDVMKRSGFILPKQDNTGEHE